MSDEFLSGAPVFPCENMQNMLTFQLDIPDPEPRLKPGVPRAQYSGSPLLLTGCPSSTEGRVEFVFPHKDKKVPSLTALLL